MPTLIAQNIQIANVFIACRLSDGLRGPAAVFTVTLPSASCPRRRRSSLIRKCLVLECFSGLNKAKEIVFSGLVVELRHATLFTLLEEIAAKVALLFCCLCYNTIKAT